LHQTTYARIRDENRYLFGPQFSHLKYIVVPVCVEDHWVVLVVDMKHTRIQMYQSCFGDSAIYEEKLKASILWLKTFLAWLTGLQIYMEYVIDTRVVSRHA
jgi:hypothetical protein